VLLVLLGLMSGCFFTEGLQAGDGVVAADGAEGVVVMGRQEGEHAWW
jgi:hypothetical protein